MTTLSSIPAPVSAARTLRGSLIPCHGRSQRAAAAAFRALGLRPLRFAGTPGRWSCLVSARPGAVVPPCLPVPAVGAFVRMRASSPPRSHERAYAPTAKPSPLQSFTAAWIAFLLSILLSLFVVSKSDGAVMVADAPSNTGSEYFLDVYLTNNNDGVVYNTATTSVISTLANQIYALGTSGASSVDDLINNQIGINIRGAPAGEIQGNWIANSSGNTITFSHLSYGYTPWLSNPDQNTMAPRFTVGNSLLELNNQAGYQPFTFADIASQVWNPADYDPIIVLTGTPEAESFFNAPNYVGTKPADTINPAFVGTDQGGFNSWSTNGPQYALINPNDFAAIPEPSTTGLLGLGLAGALLYRRREPTSVFPSVTSRRGGRAA